MVPSVTLDFTSSAVTDAPAPTYVSSQGHSSSIETSEAAIPTSEAPAAPESSSVYEAPVASPTAKAVEAAAAPAATSAAGSKRGEATFYGGNTDGGKW